MRRLQWALPLIFILFLFLPARIANTSPADHIRITVVGWNVDSGDADPQVIGARIAAFQDVDLWGLSEVNDAADAEVYESSAEEGEDAEFEGILGTTGEEDRLLVIYETNRFDYLGHEELHGINIGGNVRSPLVVHLREKENGQEFLFMVNHLYQTDDNARHTQAVMLNDWAMEQTLPVIAVGDYNYDWELSHSDCDLGYGFMTAFEHWQWVKPATLVTTQCSGWPCTYNIVLDFIFVAGEARQWEATSEIVVEAGDFPDNETTSDHRPVRAQFHLPSDERPTSDGRVAYLPVVVRPMPSTPTPTHTATATPTATVTPTPTPTQTDDGANQIVISHINYDGEVPRAESDEYALIENVGTATVSLAGWRLHAGSAGQDFYFPDIALAAGQSCRVYTNEIHDETCGLSYARGKAIWYNEGDCGYLYDGTGSLVDSYCY